LASSGFVEDSRILSVTSLDALAEIWLHDFPIKKIQLERQLGGKFPASIRFTRFLKEFIVNDPTVEKVAVACFAEDWKYHLSQDISLAERLLSKRFGNNSNEFLRAREMPKSYLDVSRSELLLECPQITTRSDLFNLLEEYEYGALLYSFYRCPLIHLSTQSNRIHGFAREREISYKYSSDGNGRITIGFGPKLITDWLRNSVSKYVQACHQEDIIPAHGIDGGASQEERLKKRWNRIRQSQV
jgi:hypothetical protein